MMAPAGISWQDFSKTGLYFPPRYYRKFEHVDEGSGLPVSFATPTNKMRAVFRDTRQHPCAAFARAPPPDG